YNGDVCVLQHVIRRVSRSKTINSTVVATTTNKNDDAIVEIAKKEGAGWFRGSEEDVLERYYLCACENCADIVVRITSDCPCIDAEIIDQVVNEHIRGGYDYTSNTLTRSYPRGMDVEVFSFDALEKAYKKASEPYEREHVTPYIYAHPEEFRIKEVTAPPELSAPHIRLTVDTEEDYALLCAVFDFLYSRNRFFGLREILNLFSEKPWLHLINKKVEQKKLLKTLKDEIEEAKRILKLQGLSRAEALLERCYEREGGNPD
ncbi:MAG: acylneuraminate cytidylyltransferase, partial [Deferribacteres bacterium]|nr:acylneuraminate cytidylyltransferase [Deferribacteres bacterium]